MQLKQHIKSLNLNCFKKLFTNHIYTKNTECQEERFGLKRVNWPEETLYPKSNALIQFAARRAPVRGKSIAPEKSMNKSAHGTNSDLGIFAN